jgi:hypothetical protein
MVYTEINQMLTNLYVRLGMDDLNVCILAGDNADVHTETQRSPDGLTKLRVPEDITGAIMSPL